ncbi:hypothetical protein C8R45DRAFT_463599 [Mycena sanguinolenta]|nr:hypothetical protein C8R45DRAFT_463599 [Mycena sanguinolenta]
MKQQVEADASPPRDLTQLCSNLSLDVLPAEILFDLPKYLHSLEDICSLFSTCRTLYRACANPSPKLVLQLAAGSGRIFFRPHPHFLLAATARQLADWAVEENHHRYRLEVAIQGGVEKLFELAIDVAGLSMDDIRRLYTYKCDVLNPLNRRLDLATGPAGDGPWTVCNDPETALLSWIIYGELFHHSMELAYLPFPRYKPLSSVIRYKWFVYCMPDVNSFRYMGFSPEEIPQFFKEYVQEDDDRFQQLSMQHATRKCLKPSLWRQELDRSPSFQATNGSLHELYISRAMHMGFKSLELLVPGGVEKLEADLELIAAGIHTSDDPREDDDTDEDDTEEEDDTGEEDNPDEEDDTDEEETESDPRAKGLLELVGDRWLFNAYPTLVADIDFTLWCNWPNDDDEYPQLMRAIRRPPQKELAGPT